MHYCLPKQWQQQLYKWKRQVDWEKGSRSFIDCEIIENLKLILPVKTKVEHKHYILFTKSSELLKSTRLPISYEYGNAYEIDKTYVVMWNLQTHSDRYESVKRISNFNECDAISLSQLAESYFLW